MDCNELLKQLPQRPGVYLMIDSLGNIIYVGKAKNLKNRVTQYFRNQKDRAPKIAEMIHHIHTVNYIVTDTELDAFIEECRLIKEIKPKYNKQMKNNQKYCYIKITAEQYPIVTKVNKITDHGAIYFGPFTSPHRVESTLEYLKDFYPIRKCTNQKLVRKVSGCLFGQLGTCLGVCTGQVSPGEYRNYIETIQQLLAGNDPIVLPELSKILDSAIENLNFEKAAQYREYYLGLRHVIGRQQLVHSSNKNRNILAVEFIDTVCAKLFFIKGNKLVDRKVFNIVTKDKPEMRQSLNQMIRDKFGAKKSEMCELVLHDFDETQIMYSYLKKNKSRIMSFWIPSTQLNKETSGLDATVVKIINRITTESR